MDNLNTRSFQSFIAKQWTSLFVLLLVALMFAFAYQGLLLPRKDFYNELWGPAFLLVHGQNPYDTASLDPELPAVWLPMAIGFFVPLGWLDEKTAMLVWYFFNVLALCLILLLSGGWGRNSYIQIILALVVFLSPITLAHLILGQFSITSVLCAVAATILISKNNHWVGAFLLALGLSKPHLLTLIVPGFALHYFLNGGYKSVIQFGFRMLTAIFILCLPLLVVYPNWIPAEIESFKANPYWTYPTMQTLFLWIFGERIGMLIWLALIGLVVWGTVFLWKKCQLEFAAYWSLALAILITPYAGPWDFVGMLPLFIYAFSNASRNQKIFIMISYLMVWGGTVYVSGMNGSHSFSFWWVPLPTMAYLAVASNWKEQLLTKTSVESTV